MTIHEVKRIHEQKQEGSYFFSRDTMRFFHQTLRSFHVSYIGNDKYLIWAPMKDHTGKKVGETKRIFDYNTGVLEMAKEN